MFLTTVWQPFHNSFDQRNGFHAPRLRRGGAQQLLLQAAGRLHRLDVGEVAGVVRGQDDEVRQTHGPGTGGKQVLLKLGAVGSCWLSLGEFTDDFSEGFQVYID